MLGIERLQNAKYIVSEWCLKYTNGHQHPSISLIIIEQDTIGETKEKGKWHSTQEPRIPKTSPMYYDGVHLNQYWPTLPVYVCAYTS